MPGPAAPAVVRAALRIAAQSLARQSRCKHSRLASGRTLATTTRSAPVAAAAHLDRLSLVVTSPSATQLLAGYFANDLREADCYLLYGSVGAGKSYFCRQFVRAACGDDDLPVPSPTFLLQNIYDQAEGPPIHHFDLYRLTAPHNLLRLDLPTSLARAVSLIEWPERLGEAAPADSLAVELQVIPADEQAALQRGGMAAPTALSDIESDGEESGDLRWRRIAFASAAPRWQHRLQTLRAVLDSSGTEFGCWVDRVQG